MSEAREPTTGEIMEVLLAFKEAVEMQFERLFREFARKSDLERLRFDVTKRFDGVDTRLDGIDTRLDGIDTRLDGIDTRFDRMDERFDRMDARFDTVESRLGGLERPAS